MKRIIFAMVALVLGVGMLTAQNRVQQLFRTSSSNAYADGSTWAASQTHYTEIVEFVDDDSIHATFVFTDTVDVDVYVVNYATNRIAIGDTSAIVDSVAATKAAGYSKTLTLVGKLNMGAGAFQLKLAFVATGNDTQATEKYKIYIKRFRNNRPNVR